MGLGQDTTVYTSTGQPLPSGTFGPSPVSTSDLQSQVSTLQDQLSATGDVVSGILSGQYTGTTPGLPSSSSSSTTMYLLIAVVGIMALVGMAKK
jgi:uncharacterized membrane protein YbjE (DUF340 family)